MSTFLIAGLGNPGRRYENTRHNVGFRAIDVLAEKLGIAVNRLKWHAVAGEGNYQGDKVILLKPQTYMNNSGLSIREVADFYKIESENILVLCDDVDIPFGSIRFREKGSAGTHNGLKSVIKELGSPDFPRIKIAVGAKGVWDLADFVLSAFSKEEEAVVQSEVHAASDCALLFLQEGAQAAMNQWNGWTFDA